MSLIKWAPMSMWDPFEEMDQMMAWPGNRAQAFVPAIDVYQDNDNVYVETALAGVDPTKVEVNIENDVLTIKGASERQSEVDDKNYYRKEIRSG
ncbi:MAG: Hsp20/alpha crystallin family protein, partial [Patescibacteria group bacterium]